MRRNLKLLIEYDGTDYAGWQAQTNALAIQTVLERTLSKLLGEATRLTGAGRTDAGVHATGQVANFYTESPIPCEGLRTALNHHLPPDVAVLSVEPVPESFHARFDARRRTYRYTILNRPYPSALHGRFVWNYGRPIPIELWDALGRELVGVHDFAAFRKTRSDRQSSVCAVSECRCWNEGEFVCVSITADAFLRGMVRAIVGTLAQLAPDPSADPETARRRLREILASRDRGQAGASAPPQGLCLTRVEYDPINL